MVSLLLWAGAAPVLAAGLLGTAVLAMLALQYRDLLPASADGPAGEGGQEGGISLPRGPVLVLGALGFLAFMAEGSMLDWSAVFLTTIRGADVGLAGMGFAAFSVAMAVVRLGGDIIVARLGPVVVVAGGAILAAAGLGVAVTLPSIAAGLLGFVLVGLGLGNIIPLLFGAAGRLKDVPAGIAISGVATLGYMGILMGPALIGLAAQVVSLPMALGGLGALLLLVAAKARLARG